MGDYIYGNSIELQGTPHLEPFKTERLLKNGVPLELKMFPANDEFVLMTVNKDGYRMNIVDCTLRVCFIELNSEFLEAHDRVLAEQPAYYSLTIMDTKTFNSPAGLSIYSRKSAVKPGAVRYIRGVYRSG